MEQQKKKRTGLVIALIACLALVGVGGVMAWYNAQSQLTNTFTTGNIKPPTTDPDEPEKPIKPETKPEDGGHKGQVDGNIVEDKWIPGSAITPGSTVDKNPNIGLAPGSDDAYVFVYVKNNFANGVTFAIDNTKWAPVAGYVDDDTNTGDNVYKGGLFMYTKVGADPALLPSDKTPVTGKDVWTGPLFKYVTASDDAVINDGDSIVVSAYLAAGKKDGAQLTANDAKAEAIKWANHPTGPTVK